MIYKKRDGTLQIKIFFVGLLIGSSYLIGDTIHKAFIKRHKELNEEEMEYQKETEHPFVTDEEVKEFLNKLNLDNI